MIKPEIGMGVTEICYSDRHAYTIIEVITDKKIVVQQDLAPTKTECRKYRIMTTLPTRMEEPTIFD